MATAGLVGGLGPESTIDYYRRIIDEWQRHDPSSAPSLVIDSLDSQRALRFAGSNRQALTEYLQSSVHRLVGAGADFAAMTANTAHLVFDELAAASPIPLISIVEVCADEAQRRGMRRVGLLGTRFTMEAAFYPDVFLRRDIVVVRPGDTDRAWVHDRYIGQLLKGDFRSETRDAFAALVGRMRDRDGIDGIILGGTELPLLISTPEIAGVAALDTTALHVTAIVKRLHDITPTA